jgi:hypothetical protein
MDKAAALRKCLGVIEGDYLVERKVAQSKVTII